MQQIVAWFNYLLGPIFFVLILFLAVRNRKKFNQFSEKSFNNQQQIISLLTEIRDVLKK